MLALWFGLVGLTGPVSASSVERTPDDWANLDQEIETLALSLSQDGIGARVGATLKVNASDFHNFSIPPATTDVRAVIFDNIRFWLEGSAGEFDYRIEAEGAAVGVPGTPVIVDAWVRWELAETVRATLGQYLRPILWGALIQPHRLLFILRTTDGQFWHARDRGFMVDGDYERLHWALSVEDGGDFQGDDLAWTARLALDVIGNGVGYAQGSIEAEDEAAMTVAVAFHDDPSAAQDGEVFALEAMFTQGPFAAHGELLDYANDGGGGTGLYSVASDTTPWSVDFAWMIEPETWEVAVRWQDVDDVVQRETLTLGINRYIEGHNLKWQLNWADTDANVAANDTEAISLGLTASL